MSKLNFYNILRFYYSFRGDRPNVVGEPGLVERVLASQEVEGSTPTGATCPNDFPDPKDQDIRTQWAGK